MIMVTSSLCNSFSFSVSILSGTKTMRLWMAGYFASQIWWLWVKFSIIIGKDLVRLGCSVDVYRGLCLLRWLHGPGLWFVHPIMPSLSESTHRSFVFVTTTLSPICKKLLPIRTILLQIGGLQRWCKALANNNEENTTILYDQKII